MQIKILPSLGFTAIFGLIALIAFTIHWSYMPTAVELSEQYAIQAKYYPIKNETDIEMAASLFVKAAQTNTSSAFKASYFLIAAKFYYKIKQWKNIKKYLLLSLQHDPGSVDAKTLLNLLLQSLPDNKETAFFINQLSLNIPNLSKRVLNQAIKQRLSMLQTRQAREEFIKTLKPSLFTISETLEK